MSRKHLLILLVQLLFLAPLGAWGGDVQRIHFVTDEEKVDGYLVALTKAAYERMGYQVDIEYMPWVRALDNVMRGKSEALLGAYYTSERAKKMIYSKAIARSELSFFKLKTTDVAYRQLSDLKGYTVGTIIGARYTPEFDEATFFTKEPVTNYATNIRKLLRGRISLLIEKKSVITYALATEYQIDAERIDTLQPPLKIAEFYNCFSMEIPGYEKKVTDFNTGLAIIIQDGTYSKIMSQVMHE